MALRKIRLGDYLELYSEKCNIPNLTVDDVSGINKEKEFFEPSKQVGSDTSNYKIVPPGYFACNLMHVGRDEVLPIAINKTKKNKTVSPAYTVFKLINEDTILSYYLFILVNSSEKDRYFWFHCDSSVRDGMEWNSFCDIELEIPPINIQKKYVDIYLGLLNNLSTFETGLDDLKILYTGYIENIRKQIKPEPILPYLQERTETNKNGENLILRGVGLKGFINPNQVRTKESLNKCNIFYKGDFVYAPSSFKNGVISYNNFYDKALCTEEYIVFKIKDEKKLNPYYLLMWLKREELGRSIDFYVMDSVRNRFYFEDMEMINIPIPSITIQDNIAKVYVEYLNRIEYGNILKEKIKNICPILIRGAVKETKGGN